MAEPNFWDRVQSIFEPRKAKVQRKVEACEEALAAQDWEGALERSRELAEEEDHPFAWEARARALWALDRPDKAIEVLRAGVSRHPKIEEMWMLLGACLIGVDDLEDAERAFRHALILRPSPTGWLQLATLIARQRRHLEALDAFHEAEQLAVIEEGGADPEAPRPPVTPRQQATIGRLTCLVELGRAGEARSVGRGLLSQPLPPALITRIHGWLARLHLDSEREGLLLEALRVYPEPWTLSELRGLRALEVPNALRWWGSVQGGPSGQPYLREAVVVARDANEALSFLKELDGGPVSWETVSVEDASGEPLGVVELSEPTLWDLPPGVAGAPGAADPDDAIDFESPA